MNESSFFDFEKWEQYLRESLRKGAFKVEEKNGLERVFSTDSAEHSFQFVNKDLIAVHYFKKKYNKHGEKNRHVEKFKLIIKKSDYFSILFPFKKYKIIVCAKGTKKPIVKSYVGESFLGVPYWSKRSLPAMFLNKLLKQQVNFDFFS